MLYQYEWKETKGGGVNEMIGVKEEDNIESVWNEVICKNDYKIKLVNFYELPGMEAQYGLEASFFRKLHRYLKVITW